MSYLLLIFAINGFAPIEAEFSSFERCLKAREELLMIQPNLKTECVNKGMRSNNQTNKTGANV